MNKQILIVGTPYSGINLLKKLTSQMGVYFNSVDEDLPHLSEIIAQEPLASSAIHLNEELLEAADCNWFDVVNLKDEFLPADLVEIFEENASTILEELGKHPCSGIADFQTTLTLPFWEKFIRSPIILVVKREAEAIVRSLTSKHQFPEDFSLALYQTYAEKIEKIKATHHVIEVSFEALIEKPEQTVSILGENLTAAGCIGINIPQGEVLNSLLQRNQNRENKEFIKTKVLYEPFTPEKRNSILRSGVQKVYDLKLDKPSFERSLSATLFKKNGLSFSYADSISITNLDIGKQKTLVFPLGNGFEKATSFRVDLTDSISLIHIQSVVIANAATELMIPVSDLQTNAGFADEGWFLFDKCPSSIHFTLPEKSSLEADMRLRVHFFIAASGMETLKYIHQFYKGSFSSPNLPITLSPSPELTDSKEQSSNLTEISQLQIDKDFFRLEMERLQTYNQELQASLSYRLGRLLTFPLRLIYEAFIKKKSPDLGTKPQ